jgi:hypothetical protein
MRIGKTPNDQIGRAHRAGASCDRQAPDSGSDASTKGACDLAGCQGLAEQGHRARGAPGSSPSGGVAPALPGRRNRCPSQGCAAFQSPRPFTAEVESAIVRTRLHGKPINATHWSTRAGRALGRGCHHYPPRVWISSNYDVRTSQLSRTSVWHKTV